MLTWPRRTWIVVDLDKLVANYRTACSMTTAIVTCVLKANAYGHGAVRVAEALSKAGCRSFAVSCADEAIQLRSAGIAGEILVMGYSQPEDMFSLIQHNVCFTVCSIADIIAAEYAAKSMNARAILHIKVDTGFHRLGFSADRITAEEIAAAAENAEHCRFAGLYSHLGLVSYERDIQQHQNLMQMHHWLEELGLDISDIHLCDSIGLVRYPQWHYSRCRVGAMLYGVRPSRSDHLPFADEETLTFYTVITQIHEVDIGEVIGYDENGETKQKTRVATLAVGYGDGYPRSLSNGGGQVLIRGKRAPVIGLICMDQMMVDVTSIPECMEGDEVILLGSGITYDEYAAWAKTNRNECITILSCRPVRVYDHAGRHVTVINELLQARQDEV